MSVVFSGCDKMSIEHDGCRVVDANDGSIVDEDEVLILMKECEFMLLSAIETYKPVPSKAISNWGWW